MYVFVYVYPSDHSLRTCLQLQLCLFRFLERPTCVGLVRSVVGLLMIETNEGLAPVSSTNGCNVPVLSSSAAALNACSIRLVILISRFSIYLYFLSFLLLYLVLSAVLLL